MASAGGVPRETITLDRVDATASTTAPLSIIACDPATVDLSDFEVWRREEGYWWGNYTFLGADGDPYTSPAWPYEYQPYWGFIHLELVGNSLKQRNVFVYASPRGFSADGSRDAAAAIFRGVESRRRRGCDVDIPWRRRRRGRIVEIPWR